MIAILLEFLYPSVCTNPDEVKIVDNHDIAYFSSVFDTKGRFLQYQKYSKKYHSYSTSVMPLLAPMYISGRI
jgi:hypothetical protein